MKVHLQVVVEAWLGVGDACWLKGGVCVRRLKLGGLQGRV